MPGLPQGLERVRRLLPALWVGVLLAVAGLATPAAFAVLPRAQAGQVAARILGQEAGLSLVFAAALLILERQRARLAAADGPGSEFSLEMLLILCAMFCTVLGYFGAQWVMPAARAGQAGLSFGQWHAISMALFGIKLCVVGWLSWRATRPR